MSGEMALAISYSLLLIGAGVLVWWGVRKYYGE